jgi:hypothetical protein
VVRARLNRLDNLSLPVRKQRVDLLVRFVADSVCMDAEIIGRKRRVLMKRLLFSLMFHQDWPNPFALLLGDPVPSSGVSVLNRHPLIGGTRRNPIPAAGPRSSRSLRH